MELEVFEKNHLQIVDSEAPSIMRIIKAGSNDKWFVVFDSPIDHDMLYWGTDDVMENFKDSPSDVYSVVQKFVDDNKG